MKTYHALSEAEVARFYVQSKGAVEFLPRNADALVADVERYLRASRLDHRLDEAVTIAKAAFEIADQVREQQTPEDFQASVRDQFGDLREINQAAQQYADELALAGRVSQMDMKEFAAERGRLGRHKTTADFLLGM
jgi:hypothetical protein